MTAAPDFRSPEFGDWYAARVEYATENQGLLPITDALARAGVPYTVDQTGGFCMCVNVPLAEGGTPYLYVTASDYDDGTAVVGMYWDCGEANYHSEGVDVAYNLPLERLGPVVRTLAADVAANGSPCPICNGLPT